jgi:ubiquitin-protein ligase
MSNPSIRRLAQDVADLARSPLDDQGIFYLHNESNIRAGMAVVRGPEDSHYTDGYYLFEFAFPEDYPTSPPKVKILTRAHAFPQYPGATTKLVRLHPNLYTDGKVCLSLLGTWAGEPWTSCCTIRTVLLALQSILDGDPYLHEPKVSDTDSSHTPYNEAVRFHNLHDALALFRRDTFDRLPVELQTRLEHPVRTSIERTIQRLKQGYENSNGYTSQSLEIRKYSFSTRSDYPLLLGLLESLHAAPTSATSDTKLTESASSVPT